MDRKPNALEWVSALAFYAASIGTLTAIILCLLGSFASAHQTKTIKKNMGGLIDKQVAAYKKDARRGTHFVIDGYCASACTTILGIIPRERVCVTEKAALGFHSGYYWTPFWRIHSSKATQQMWSYDPPEVQAELIATHFWNGGLGQKHLDMMWIYASRFYPLCQSKPGRS
jgi:hypothetical protein